MDERTCRELTWYCSKGCRSNKLRAEQLSEVKKETLKSGSDLCKSDFHLLIRGEKVDGTVLTVQDSLRSGVRERLQFYRYLVDPNKFRFLTVVRIVAIVIKAVKAMLSRSYHRIGGTLTRFSP